MLGGDRDRERGVVLLRGPAGCGKTATALAVYRHYAGRPGCGRCLLIAPNAQAADDLKRRLLRESGGAVLAPQVTTFAALAERILAATGSEHRRLSGFQRHLLLRNFFNELKDSGELTAFKSVADTPGIVTAIDRAIAELKRAAIEPATLRSAIAPNDDKPAQLHAIYSRYQRHLHDSRAYDLEGQMWQARENLAAAIENKKTTGLEGVDAITADGFTDFTPTQLEILKLAATQVPRTIITLTVAEDRRGRMWQWTNRMLNSIRGAFGDDLTEITLSPDERDNLRKLWDSVFDFEADPCELPENLSLVAAAGIEGEVAETARRVKRLLLGGATAGSIAVLARNIEPYRGVIGRVFRDHDIPLPPAAMPLTDVPIIRFLLAAAEISPEFAFADVLKVISSSYFSNTSNTSNNSPDAIGKFDETTIAAAQFIVREGNVLGGRDAYREAGERLAKRLPSADEDKYEYENQSAAAFSAEQLTEAIDMLEKLFSLAESVKTPGNFLALAEQLNLTQSACKLDDPQLIARDLRAIAALTGAIEQIDPDCQPTVQQFVEALPYVPCPTARGESLVVVLDVLDSRALRSDHVFLLGVNEGKFPSTLRESSLVRESDRRNWASRGAVLDVRDDLAAREMLLFYLAASRADKSLTLSWLQSDATGGAAEPSSFLLSMLAPCGGLTRARANGKVHTIYPGEFVPQADDIASAHDAFNAGVADLVAGSDEHGDAAAWVAKNMAPQLGRVAMGIWTNHRRWSSDLADEFDGRLSDKALLEKLAAKYPDEVVFSATRLNSYAQCPWQYFASYVLKLEPILQPERRLEPVARGIFIHDVLFRFYTSLREQAGGAVKLVSFEESQLQTLLDDCIDTEAGRVDIRRPPYPMLWKIQLTEMRRQLWNYISRQRIDAGEVASTYFELAFGLSSDRLESADPASTTEPIAVTTPAGDVKLDGRIDRVDIVEGDSGRAVSVVDYKTGSLPSSGDIAKCEHLQLPLYIDAAEKLLNLPIAGGAFHHVGDGKKKTQPFTPGEKFGSPKLTAERFDEIRRNVREKVGEMVTAMSEGRFDAMTPHKCASYCPFRQICQYSDHRAELKSPAQPEEQE